MLVVVAERPRLLRVTGKRIKSGHIVPIARGDEKVVSDSRRIGSAGRIMCLSGRSTSGAECNDPASRWFSITVRYGCNND